MITKQSLRAYFEKLGLKAEIGDIYFALHTYGPQTISELARSSGIERVSIYRLLDELKASGLVEVETRYKRSLIRSAPIENVQYILAGKEQELKELQRDFASIAKDLTGTTIHSATTRVQFYEGADGLRQMVWNQTKGKGENLSILYDGIQHHEGNKAFFERWVRECNKNKIQFRGIIGEQFINAQKKWYATHSNERLERWSSRFISQETFPIPYSLVIYDNVVLYYNWNNDQISGIEIHNQEIARLQRQFFEMLWSQAKPVDDLVGPRGSDMV